MTTLMLIHEARGLGVLIGLAILPFFLAYRMKQAGLTLRDIIGR